MSNSTRILVILAAVCFAVLWFANLQYRDLFQTDEGRYAEIPREMVASGDWLTPRLDGLKYFEKPALQYWTTAVAYELFGQSNWTSRLWTALTGFLGVLMTAWVGWRLFDRRTAWCAALLLGSGMYYIIMGHFNTLDMGVSFFMCMSAFAFLLAMQSADDAQGSASAARPLEVPEGGGGRGAPIGAPGAADAQGSASAAGGRTPGAAASNIARRRGWMYLAWAAAALGMLSKGLEAVVLPGAVFIIYTLISRDWKRWKQLHWYGGVIIFLIIAAPWFVAVSLRNPEFFHHFFIYEHFQRFLTPVAHRPGAWWYFIPVLLFGLLPWWPQFVRSIVRVFWRADANAQTSGFHYTLFLWIWCVLIFVFFSFSDSKLMSYILPIMPALALIIGRELAQRRRGDVFISAILCMLLAIVGLWLAPLLQRDGGNVSLELYKAFLPWLVVGCALLLIIAIAGFFTAYFRQVGVAMALLGVALFLATQVVTTGAQVFSPVYSGHSLAKQINAYNKPGIPFYSLNDYQQSLPFYLKRTLTLVAYQGELAFGISREPDQWIPTLPDFIARWQNDPQALAVMPITTYNELAKQGVPMQVIGRDPERVAVKKP
ncbi:MAG: phospholipid carrier-dependent glycosyltransferase [Gammaproteobacteria bacterium]